MLRCALNSLPSNCSWSSEMFEENRKKAAVFSTAHKSQLKHQRLELTTECITFIFQFSKKNIINDV